MLDPIPVDCYLPSFGNQLPPGNQAACLRRLTRCMSVHRKYPLVSARRPSKGLQSFPKRTEVPSPTTAVGNHPQGHDVLRLRPLGQIVPYALQPRLSMDWTVATVTPPWKVGFSEPTRTWVATLLCKYGHKEASNWGTKARDGAMRRISFSGLSFIHCSITPAATLVLPKPVAINSNPLSPPYIIFEFIASMARSWYGRGSSRRSAYCFSFRNRSKQELAVPKQDSSTDIHF